jgi:hypothetical protein
LVITDDNPEPDAHGVLSGDGPTVAPRCGSSAYVEDATRRLRLMKCHQYR